MKEHHRHQRHESRRHERDERERERTPASSSAARWSLPLVEHPRLDLQTDIARMRVVPIAAGESPWLEVENDHAHTHAQPAVEVDGSGGVTRVHVSGAWAGDPSWWNGPWWDSAFWEKKFWKRAFRTMVTAHVPVDVHGQIRSNAAKLHVERLVGCDLSIETDAGSVTVEDVSGRLRLATQAGRIDARRISGAIDIATSAGAVNAEVLSLLPGTHRIRTNVGAVRIELARGMPVRIAARTTMGATRVDFPVTPDAEAELDIEADLGAVRVSESSHRHDARDPIAAGPYRTPASTAAIAPRNDAEIEQILERVADGSITPEAARDLLRALGVT